MKIKDIIIRGIEKNDSDLKTSNKSFSYISDDDAFYSYNEKIAYMCRDTNAMFIYGLTAKYKNFFSNTTSKHFSKILNVCNEKEIDNQILF